MKQVVHVQVIGYLFGQYKRIRNEWTGVLTGKPFGFGGSNIRPEATGYGLVYFTRSILEDRLGTELQGKRVAVSGSGNVAQFAVEKLLTLGAVPVSMSDSGGCVVEPEGFTIEGLSQVMRIKAERGSLREYKPSAKGAPACFSPACFPCSVPADDRTARPGGLRFVTPPRRAAATLPQGV